MIRKRKRKEIRIEKEINKKKKRNIMNIRINSIFYINKLFQLLSNNSN